MSIGRTREEQEITRMLASTLVQKEVIEPMEKIGWSHAAPPPPVYGTTPATEGAPAPASTPAAPAQGGQPTPAAPAQPQSGAPAKADTPPGQPAPATDIVAVFESLRDSNGLIMGKYKTIEEALKGAGHLANMAKQAFRERDEALARVNTAPAPAPATQPVAAPAAAPVPAPSLVASRAALEKAQARLDAVLSKTEENGGVFDAETLKEFTLANRELAERAADVRVQENQHERDSRERAENDRWAAVDAHMREHHPDSLNLSAEIGVHIASDPVLQEAVSALVAQGKEIQASVLAWKSYQTAVGNGTAAVERVKAEEKEADLQAKEQVRQELLEKARRDAGVIQGSAGGMGIHENPDTAPSREELEAARSQMRMEGEGLGSASAARFRHLLIGRHLDPAVFGPR